MPTSYSLNSSEPDADIKSSNVCCGMATEINEP